MYGIDLANSSQPAKTIYWTIKHVGPIPYGETFLTRYVCWLPDNSTIEVGPDVTTDQLMSLAQAIDDAEEGER